ncbi:MAG TPA: hypothetical protein VN673_04305 [Clostridia bacterium]|nr:hypothetical protein [Clostridia bacterium]
MNTLLVSAILAGALASSTFASEPAGYVVCWGNQDLAPAQPFEHKPDRAGLVRVGKEIITNAVEIAAGMQHALALLGDGRVVGWGFNSENALQIPSLQNVKGLGAGDGFSLALHRDGTLTFWGRIVSGSPGMLPKLPPVAALSAGRSSVLVLQNDGTVAGWGRAYEPAPELADVVAISTSRTRYPTSLAVRRNGSVVSWGFKSRPPPTGLSNVVSVAAGDNYNLALTKEGTVHAWGENDAGQATGVPGGDNDSGLVMIRARLLTNVVAIATGSAFNLVGRPCSFSLALTRDGGLECWGQMAGEPAYVPRGLSNVIAIAAGQNYAIAITTNQVVARRFR